MKWCIPAKTFLIGEYAAIAGEGAILLTTSPCFELTLVKDQGIDSIHPNSPAGKWWNAQSHTNKFGLKWYDPYKGKGGLGASSAQFIGAYLASCYIKQISADKDTLLDAYYQVAWNEKGLKPSGYDVLAQLHKGCVYIHKQQSLLEIFNWPFRTLSFLLVHTGAKLATHEHLQTATLTSDIERLAFIVQQAKEAIDEQEEEAFIEAISAYHKKLEALGLVSKNTLKEIEILNGFLSLEAIKGCGAMGADVVLLVMKTEDLEQQANTLKERGYHLLASSFTLFRRTGNEIF